MAEKKTPWPPDICYLEGGPYRIVDRQLVRYFDLVEDAGKYKSVERCAYTVGTLVPA